MIIHTIEDQLIFHEGLRTDAYYCPGGYVTIGVGRNLEAQGLTDEEQRHLFGTANLSKYEVIDIIKKVGVTVEQALYLLANDIALCKSDLQKNFKWFDDLDPVRQKVIIDMRFNLGSTGFKEFKKMIEALENHDYNKAADEMRDSVWYYQVGLRAKRLAKMMITGEDYKA